MKPSEKPSPQQGRPHRAVTGRSAGPWAGLLTLMLTLMLTLTTALPGCGPGVGGTGTGESAAELVLFGASVASVCNAPLAGSLSCDTSATAIEPLAGTQPVRYLDAAQGANTLVDFKDNSVHLVATCQRLDFIGDWGVTSAQDQRYFGSVLVVGQITRMPATLLVQADPASLSGDLIAVLRDAQGKLLLGPLVLKRAPLPLPVAPACPSASD